MKKMTKIASILFLSSVVLASGSGVALAADPMKANSKATVDFKDSDIPLGFADSGATNISFGKVDIKGDDESYSSIYTADTFTELDAATKFAPLNVSVRDDRGTKPGWSVYVEMTKQFTNTNDADNELTGATLELSATDAASNKAVSGRTAPSNYNKNVIIGKDANNSGSLAIFGADKGEGAGTWTVFFGDRIESATQPEESVKNDNVKLHIPGDAVKITDASYEADLTWTLVDAPL